MLNGSHKLVICSFVPVPGMDMDGDEVGPCSWCGGPMMLSKGSDNCYTVCCSMAGVALSVLKCVQFVLCCLCGVL